MTKKTYNVENIDCPNCAADIERKIAAIPEVKEAVLTYATKQLRVTAEDPDALLGEIKETASAVEPDIVISPKEDAEPRSGKDTSNQERSSKSSHLTDENKKELMNLACGTVLFIAAVILKHFDFSIVSVVFFVLSYIVLGGEIIVTAVRNLTHGQVFDENFLMSIATLGAFAIQEYAEAVGVMLFYRIGELFEDIAVERSRSQIMDAVDMRPDVVTRIAADGLHTIPAEEAAAGEIVAVAGVTGLSIGETACDSEHIEALPFVHIDEPTVSMMFLVNDSPFAGKEGKYVTSRNLRERLFKEVETNVSMRVEETDSTDMFKVSGRGELHLSILIEQMRRQDFEFAVPRPRVIMKTDERGKLLEPIEELTVDVPQEYVGVVMEKLGQRKAELINMLAQNDGSVTRLIFTIPARSLLGYRSELLTDTRGNGVMSHIFHGYDAFKGEIEESTHGSLICHETGDTCSYGLFNTQERGRLFIGPGVAVYEGQVVGECSRNEDIVVNVCKKKHVTNMRASGSDEALRLTPPALMSLEQCIEFIGDDELVEVTPKSIRLRKRLLTKDARVKQANRNE